MLAPHLYAYLYDGPRESYVLLLRLIGFGHRLSTPLEAIYRLLIACVATLLQDIRLTPILKMILHQSFCQSAFKKITSNLTVLNLSRDNKSGISSDILHIRPASSTQVFPSSQQQHSPPPYHQPSSPLRDTSIFTFHRQLSPSSKSTHDRPVFFLIRPPDPIPPTPPEPPWSNSAV